MQSDTARPLENSLEWSMKRRNWPKSTGELRRPALRGFCLRDMNMWPGVLWPRPGVGLYSMPRHWCNYPILQPLVGKRDNKAHRGKKNVRTGLFYIFTSIANTREHAEVRQVPSFMGKRFPSRNSSGSIVLTNCDPSRIMGPSLSRRTKPSHILASLPIPEEAPLTHWIQEGQHWRRGSLPLGKPASATRDHCHRVFI